METTVGVTSATTVAVGDDVADAVGDGGLDD